MVGLNEKDIAALERRIVNDADSHLTRSQIFAVRLFCHRLYQVLNDKLAKEDDITVERTSKYYFAYLTGQR